MEKKNSREERPLGGGGIEEGACRRFYDIVKEKIRKGIESARWWLPMQCAPDFLLSGYPVEKVERVKSTVIMSTLIPVHGKDVRIELSEEAYKLFTELGVYEVVLHALALDDEEYGRWLLRVQPIRIRSPIEEVDTSEAPR